MLVAFLMLNDHVQGSGCSGQANTGQASSKGCGPPAQGGQSFREVG